MVLLVIVFYHPYKALYGNDTRKLRPKKNNKYILSPCVLQNNEKNMDMVIKWERDV